MIPAFVLGAPESGVSAVFLAGLLVHGLIARFLAQGAKMIFAGRAFLYGVAAHQEQGAEHAVDLLHDELKQLMSQLHSPDQSC